MNVSIPHGKKVEEIKKTYLRFLIRNRSLDGKDKNKIIGVCYLQITNEDGSAIQDIHCYLPMIKLDSDADYTCVNGYFYSLKTSAILSQKNSLNQMTAYQLSSEKLKDFIEIRVKVVSTQLTQNGMENRFCISYRINFLI